MQQSGNTRYHDLANTIRSDGVQCTVWLVQVRSSGMVDRDSFMNLLLFLSLSGSAVAGLFCGLSGTYSPKGVLFLMVFPQQTH